VGKALRTECVSWRHHGNLGDDMIFAAQEQLFKGVLDLGQYIESPEALLIGGGTFVPKAFEHPDLVALSRELPTAFFGTGIGDPTFWGTEYIPGWVEALNNAVFLGVRGPLSKDRAESWGVAPHHVEWVGDAALYFAEPLDESRQSGSQLGVNLGTSYGQLYGFNEPALEAAVVAALKKLVSLGWHVTLVCAWPSDDPVIDRVAHAAGVRAVEHWHDDYQRALASVSRFDLMICEKLHVGVVAACRSVPFVALNYRSKVLDFCQ
jgi:polysaccharide pyruvyl transferase WcaK-like protein